MFYRYPQRYGIEALNVHGLRTISVVHTVGAFCVIAFVVAHVYLITTGRTVTSNLKAMITGDEELEDGALPGHPATAGHEHALYESIPGG